MMSPLPEEAIDEILSRLPVKYLLRFRSVCKSWRCSIDSPYFVKLHLNRSIEDRTNLSVLLQSKSRCIIGSGSVDSFLESGNLIRRRLNYTPNDGSVSVRGSCNGLFFLTWPDAGVLWNPATRETRELPDRCCKRKSKKPRLSSEDVCVHYGGLGYDSVCDDYKVVRLEFRGNFDEPGMRMHFPDEVDVYSFNSNSCHNVIVESPYNSSDVEFGAGEVVIHGAMHWPLCEQGIVAFDFSSETFVAVSHPPTDRSLCGENCSKTLEDLGGNLSVFFHHFNNVGSHVDIWVMKDYGVKESWTKLITITARELGYSHTPNTPYLRPIACSKSGDQILFRRNSRDLLWYDVERRKMIKKIAGSGFGSLVAYTESLVSLNVRAGAGAEGDDDIEQQLMR